MNKEPIEFYACTGTPDNTIILQGKCNSFKYLIELWINDIYPQAVIVPSTTEGEALPSYTLDISNAAYLNKDFCDEYEEKLTKAHIKRMAQHQWKIDEHHTGVAPETYEEGFEMGLKKAFYLMKQFNNIQNHD